MTNCNQVHIRWLEQQEYVSCWQAMQHYTNQRNEKSYDEIWLLEHYPVFTQGQSGKDEHILVKNSIPIVQTDRGGQVTYHGPGQLMMYTLIDLKRKKLNIRQYVDTLETSVIQLLNNFGLTAYSKQTAPGVYLEEKKICSIGLRVRRGCTFHGLAFNIAMEMSPFKQINPCGFSDLQMTQLSHFTKAPPLVELGKKLAIYLCKRLCYEQTIWLDESNHGKISNNEK